jgi:UDP-sulfoquinovose synthase
VWNQFATVHSVAELAERVQAVAGSLGLAAEIAAVENPRLEAESHYYNPDREHLIRLGYEPTTDVAAELRTVLEDLLPHRARIVAHRAGLVPDVHWDGTRRRVRMMRRSRGEAA